MRLRGYGWNASGGGVGNGGETAMPRRDETPMNAGKIANRRQLSHGAGAC